jgi:N-acetylmuramoyl-L-alanine amidase
MIINKELNMLMRVSNIHIKIFSGVILALILLFLVAPNQLNAQSREVVARNGDGIHKLLKRNGIDPLKYSEAFVELNKTRLGEGNTLFTGVKYRLPDTEPLKTESGKNDEFVVIQMDESGNENKTTTVSKSTLSSKALDYRLFGPKNDDIQIKSNELKGAVYYLSAGHGGPDPGAMGKYQGHVICEDEYAYDFTLRMAKNLVERGAIVYMITIDKNDGIRDEPFLKPDKDEICYPNKAIPLNQTKRLQQRVESVNQLYKKYGNTFQRFIAIHVDSRSQSENIDIFFYHDSKSNTGKRAASILQQTFMNKYREVQPGRGYSGTVSSRNLYELKNTYPTGVYIELANMNHQRDIKRLVIPDNRQAVANWLTLGLIEDFKSDK